MDNFWGLRGGKVSGASELHIFALGSMTDLQIQGKTPDGIGLWPHNCNHFLHYSSALSVVCTKINKKESTKTMTLGTQTIHL